MGIKDKEMLIYSLLEGEGRNNKMIKNNNINNHYNDDIAMIIPIMRRRRTRRRYNIQIEKAKTKISREVMIN